MKIKAIHAMSSAQASRKKIKGHQNEIDFNIRFGDRQAKINYSGASSDCVIKDKSFLKLLKKRIKIRGNNVSLKSGNTIQIHLGWLPELTDKNIWMRNLHREVIKGKEVTTSGHGIDFNKQKSVLKRFSFWKKYLGKGEILCYRESEDEWIFFNMDDTINFIIDNFEWRLLDTGRLKGDYSGKQYLTYEYRSEHHKECFVLGAHGSKKGKEFIDLLIRKIPYLKETR